MNTTTLECIRLEIESINLKKQLINKYAGFDDEVSKIITKDSRAAIKQSQEALLIFSKL